MLATLLTVVALLVLLQTSLVGTLIMAALTPLIGWVSEKLYDGLKTILPAYDRLPAVVHQVMAPMIGFGLGWVTSHLGLAAVLGLEGVQADFFAGILNAGVMAGIKRWEKSKEPVDATVVLSASRASAG
jgi:hypothetical protein